MMKKLLCILSTITALQGIGVYAAESEWAYDDNVRPLSQAVSGGTAPVRFIAVFTNAVSTTSSNNINSRANYAARFRGTNQVDVWTNGAIIPTPSNAAWVVTSGVHYLRYDVNYSLTNKALNHTDKMFGVYFTDSTATNLAPTNRVAGLLFGYNLSKLATPTTLNKIPTNRVLKPLTNNLPLSGTIVAIAEVDLNQTPAGLRVWYSTGNNNFDINNPNFSTNVSLTSFRALRFHATGHFPSTSEMDFVTMNHTRKSTLWDEVIQPPANVTQSSLFITLAEPIPAMLPGQTNVMNFFVKNTGKNVQASDPPVVVSLTHNGSPSQFTILSNIQSFTKFDSLATTNIYFTIIAGQEEGSFVFTANVSSSQASDDTQVPLSIGPQVRYLSHTINEISGGTFTNLYEPGETLSISVVSTNDGTLNISNMTSKLSAPASTFTVTPASYFYPSVPIGSSLTSTFTVVVNSSALDGNYTFASVNSTTDTTWKTDFSVPVFHRAVPSASTSLTINVTQGDVASNQLMLTNAGNVSVSFSATDNGYAPISVYGCTSNYQQLVANMQPYLMSDNPDTNIFVPIKWNRMNPPFDFNRNFNTTSLTYISDSINLGFNMPVKGASVSSFKIYANGFIEFPVSPLIWVAPNLDVPFATNYPSLNTNSIYCKRDGDRCIVSWKDRSNKEFQLWMYKNGQFRFVYASMTNYPYIGMYYNNAFISVNQMAKSPNQISEYPENSYLLTPQSWVTWQPAQGVVDRSAGTSNHTVVPVVVTADTRSEIYSTSLNSKFNLLLTWGNGTTSTVPITVNVSSPFYGLSVPTNLTIQGPAGLISATNMLIINTGNVVNSYSITDAGQRQYSWSRVSYAWVDSTQEDGHDLSLSDFNYTTNGSGYTDLIPIGFNFNYFGNVYTQLSIGVGGCISLGQARNMDRLWDPYYNEFNIPVSTYSNIIFLTYQYGVFPPTNYLNTSEHPTVMSNNLPWLTPIRHWGMRPPSGNNINMPSKTPSTNPVAGQLIAPFWNDLTMSDQSKVSYKQLDDRFVVSWDKMMHRKGGIDQSFQAVLYKSGEIVFQYSTLNDDYSWREAEIGLRDTSNRYVRASLAYTNNSIEANSSATIYYTSNAIVTTTYTNVNGIPLDAPIITTNYTVVTNYAEQVTQQAILFYPTQAQVLDVDPIQGTIPTGGTNIIVIKGDLGSISNTLLTVSYRQSNTNATYNNWQQIETTVSVSIIAMTNLPAPPPSSPEQRLLMDTMFGYDGYIDVVQNADGTRGISWLPPEDSLPRTYTVWFTTSLFEEWQKLAILTNRYSYKDTQHSDEPVIYYKVTVE